MKRFTAKILAIFLAGLAVFCAGCTGRGTQSLSSSSGSISGDVMIKPGAHESAPDETLNIELLQLGEPQSGDTLAVIKTSAGDITVRFFPEEAPLAVENFLALAENGYYDGVIFHNVIADYLIQSGDPTGTGAGGESSFLGSGGEPVAFADEFSPNLFHLSGALAMANPGTPDSNASQFFIVADCTVSTDELARLEALGYPAELINAYRICGGIPQFDYRYTVFGCVVDGMDVVDKISHTHTAGAAGGRPTEDVTIESIEITSR